MFAIVMMSSMFTNSSPLTSPGVTELSIVAQAVLESHWGQSRFAIEGNNILGIHTWNFNEPHLKPLNIDNIIYLFTIFLQI